MSHCETTAGNNAVNNMVRVGDYVLDPSTIEYVNVDDGYLRIRGHEETLYVGYCTAGMFAALLLRASGCALTRSRAERSELVLKLESIASREVADLADVRSTFKQASELLDAEELAAKSLRSALEEARNGFLAIAA